MTIYHESEEVALQPTAPGPRDVCAVPRPQVSARVIPVFDTRGSMPAHSVGQARSFAASAEPVAARLPQPGRSVAVLLPCRNEEVTINKVVRDFQRSLPAAEIYVYDNASTDRTAEVAAAAGAVVRSVSQPGKGNVLRRMFADIEASVYVLADGDDTYDPTAAPELVRRLVDANLDMVVATRLEDQDDVNAYRRGHRRGNQLLTQSVHWLFGAGSSDMLSGYRVLSRRFVKSFPAVSSGFESETEMTVHALDLNLPFEEVATSYGERPADSSSKLRTIPDGLKILTFILRLCKDYRPLRFFGAHVVACWSAAAFAVFIADGQLHAWTPLAFVAATLTVLGMIFLLAGIILDSLRRNRREVKRMLYLAVRMHPAEPADRLSSSTRPLASRA